jgi:hypothetical protein
LQNQPASTYGVICDSTNTPISQGITVAQAYALPAQCAGFKSLKMLLNAGTATIILSRKT